MSDSFFVLAASVILFALAFAGLAAGLLLGRRGLSGNCAGCLRETCCRLEEDGLRGSPD